MDDLLLFLNCLFVWNAAGGLVVLVVNWNLRYAYDLLVIGLDGRFLAVTCSVGH